MPSAKANILKTLNKRFGAVPSTAISIVEHAGFEQLEAMFDRALEANSLAEWLSQVAD